MKKITGVSVVDGELVTHEAEVYYCICIKDKEYQVPEGMAVLGQMPPNFEKGNEYERLQDEN